jgi:hypothetical protein
VEAFLQQFPCNYVYFHRNASKLLRETRSRNTAHDAQRATPIRHQGPLREQPLNGNGIATWQLGVGRRAPRRAAAEVEGHHPLSLRNSTGNNQQNCCNQQAASSKAAKQAANSKQQTANSNSNSTADSTQHASRMDDGRWTMDGSQSNNGK